MHPAHTLALLLFVLLNVDAGVNADCDHPTPVLAFQGAFTASAVSTLPPNAAKEISGFDAAVNNYHIVIDILSKKKVCAADRVAFTASKAIALHDALNQVGWFSLVGFNVGSFFYGKGLLTCGNAVSMALDFFSLVRREFERLDLSDFYNLEYGSVSGIIQFFEKYGLSLEDDLPDLADQLYVQNSNVTKNSHCPAAR